MRRTCRNISDEQIDRLWFAYSKVAESSPDHISENKKHKKQRPRKNKARASATLEEDETGASAAEAEVEQMMWQDWMAGVSLVGAEADSWATEEAGASAGSVGASVECNRTTVYLDHTVMFVAIHT